MIIGIEAQPTAGFVVGGGFNEQATVDDVAPLADQERAFKQVCVTLASKLLTKATDNLAQIKLVNPTQPIGVDTTFTLTLTFTNAPTADPLAQDRDVDSALVPASTTREDAIEVAVDVCVQVANELLTLRGGI